MTDVLIPGFDLDDFVTRTLAEDLGEGGDVTSRAVIPENARFTAEMNCREPMIVAGIGFWGYTIVREVLPVGCAVPEVVNFGCEPQTITTKVTDEMLRTVLHEFRVGKFWV